MLVVTGWIELRISALDSIHLKSLNRLPRLAWLPWSVHVEPLRDP